MPSYSYEAVDASGLMSKGTMDVLNQSEALQRIKEMGLFPTMVQPANAMPRRMPVPIRQKRPLSPNLLRMGRVKTDALTIFTRQLATLVDVGMPLLRGLRMLEKQERNPTMKRVIGEISRTVESGGTMTEALMAHPKVFNNLYVSMVRAGEAGGILDQVLRRQAEFMEKAQKIKSKVKAAMFYPAAVLSVATAIMMLLMAFVVPRFQSVFEGMLNGRPLPAFTLAVFHVSGLVKNHILEVGVCALVFIISFQLLVHTRTGRKWFDGFKLVMPIVGGVFRKVSLARFTRTLGTLLGSGVPILQALSVVKETAGNAVVGEMISKVHDSVKEGGTLAEPFKASRIFPEVVGGMVDVGEQTGALPEMLLKIADNCDEEVDNAVSAMTSLLEPVLLVFLALIVGSIVIAMFLPLLRIIQDLTL